MAHDTGHKPVLLSETIAALAVKPDGLYVDGTLGRAGHTREILALGGKVLGIDRDDQALEEVAGIAGVEPELFAKLSVAKGRHGDLKRLADEKGWKKVDGILLDLGVSSPQLDEAGRGFSFLRDGPLDMRMDRAEGVSAADIVNDEDAGDLAKIFRDLGEEPQSGRIAKAIVASRAKKRFETTLELADFIERLIGRRGGHHPATRVFQALRMAVNDEMGELEKALQDGMSILKPGGRFAIITFESLTDRVVKRFFAAHVGRMVSLQQGGERWEGALPRAVAVTRKAVRAAEEEVNLNPRSRSAKLRVIEVKEN
jgi:16S rRNA (cytosine1402-N4)-methyltransferase